MLIFLSFFFSPTAYSLTCYQCKTSSEKECERNQTLVECMRCRFFIPLYNSNVFSSRRRWKVFQSYIHEEVLAFIVHKHLLQIH